MLRTLFVLILIAVGGYFALQAPFYALLFYIGNAYFRPEDWVWTNLIGKLNLSLIAGWYVVAITIISGQRLVWNRRLSILALFLAHTFLAAVFSENLSYSWPYWVDFFKTMIITYAMIVLVTDIAKLRLLLLVMVLAVGVEGAKQGWFYLLFQPSWGGNPNAIRFLGDNNGVALGMLMIAPVIVLLAQTSRRQWLRPVYGVMLIGVLGRAITTYSRGAMLAAAALGISWWIHSQKKCLVTIAIAFLSFATLAVMPQQYWDRMTTIQTYEEEQDKSALGRLHFWKVAVSMANAHPLVGVGFNGYLPSYPLYDFSEGRYGKLRAAHSMYFQVLADLGYVGIVLFTAILLTSVSSCRRVRRLQAIDSSLGELWLCARALEASLIALLVGGAFLSSAYAEMFWHFIGLTIVVERLALERLAESKAVRVLAPEMALEPSPLIRATELRTSPIAR